MTPATPAPPRLGGREWAMLLTLSVLWGGSFVFNGIALRGFPPLTVTWLRVAIAAALLLPALRLAGLRLPRGGRVWLALLVMAVLNNAIPFTLIVWAQQHMAAGLAAILNATTPLFTVLLAHALTRDERLDGPKLLGVALGFAGAAVTIGPALLLGLGGGIAAPLASLAAAFCYGLSGVFGRRFRRLGMAPLATAAGQVTASTLLLLPAMLWVDRPWALPAPPAEAWAAVIGLGSVSTALAYALFFRILAAAGATNLSLVTLLVPASAILIGAFALDETLLPRHFAGMGLIALGLACLDGRPLRWLLRRVGA